VVRHVTKPIAFETPQGFGDVLPRFENQVT